MACIALIVLIRSLNDLLVRGVTLLSLANSLRSSFIVLTKYLVRARFFRIILVRSLRSFTSSNSSPEYYLPSNDISMQQGIDNVISNTCVVIFASFVDMHSFAISVIIKFQFCDAYLGIQSKSHLKLKWNIYTFSKVDVYLIIVWHFHLFHKAMFQILISIFKK